MLENPTAVVVGATDLDTATSFFGMLGFETAGGRAGGRTLAAAGSWTGLVELVPVDGPTLEPGPFDIGPYDVSLYTRDVERSRRLLTDAGWRCGPTGIVRLGPLEMHQMKVDGPDGLRVVLIESNRRRPSILDHDANALHSEVHSVVWCVPSLADAVPFWRDAAGLGQVMEFPIDDPAVATFLELPRERVPLRMALISGDDERPMRFELLEFPDDAGPAVTATATSVGVQALVFDVDDPEQAFAALATNLDGDGAARSAGAVGGDAPGGVRFELRRRIS